MLQRCSALATLKSAKLVPASTAVPAAAGNQQNEKDNYEKRRGIHVRLPRNAAYCAAWNSGFLTTFSWVVRFQERHVARWRIVTRLHQLACYLLKGQSRRSGCAPMTTGLPRQEDNFSRSGGTATPATIGTVAYGTTPTAQLASVPVV
jgi:hypothetical protein